MNPGFIVADVWLDTELTIDLVEPFVRKTRIIRARAKARPFIAFLVAHWFKPDAFKLGRQEGLLFTTLENIFGNALSQALKDLIKTLSDTAKRVDVNPDIVCNLFDSLGRIEGAAGNLRGPLFELIVAFTAHRLWAGHFYLGKKINNNGRQAEIDIIHVQTEKILAIECKGHAPGREVSLEEVKVWVEERLPIWNEWMNQETEFKDKPHWFEYWTSASFSSEAADYIENRASSTKKYKIATVSGENVLDLVRRTKEKRLCETLNEHYLRHPLAQMKD